MKTIAFEGRVRVGSDDGRRFELIGDGEMLEARFESLGDAIAIARVAQRADARVNRLAGFVPFRIRAGPRMVIELGRNSDPRPGGFSRAGVLSRLLGLPVSAVRLDRSPETRANPKGA